jgi:flagellar protein FlaG
MHMSSVITGNFGYQPTANVAVANGAAELNKVKNSSEAIQLQSTTKAEPQEQAEQNVTLDELGGAVENINQFVNSQGRTLNFSVLTMAKAIKRLQEDLGSATGLMFDKTI